MGEGEEKKRRKRGLFLRHIILDKGRGKKKEGQWPFSAKSAAPRKERRKEGWELSIVTLSPVFVKKEGGTV